MTTMTTTDQVDALLARCPAHVQSMVPYRPGKPLEELKAEFGFDQVIKLASNENPFGTSPKAIVAMTEALQQGFRYGDPISRRLRAAIGTRFGVDPAEVAIAAGSENLLAIVSRAFMQPGDRAVMGYGAFMGFEIHAGAIGGQMVKVESPGYRFSPELLIAACREHNPKVLYLPNPNNPTGTYLTTEELRQVIDGCPPTTLVLIDEAYTEFCQHLDDYPDALTMRQDNVVVCRTFSKAYGLAGMRVAYAVGHEKVIQQLMKVKMTFEPSNVAQAGAIAALQDEDFLKKVVANNETEKNRYYEFFMQHHCHYVSSSGNFVLLKLRDTDQVEALNNALLQRGIAIRPLAAFGYPDCVRISIGLPEENTALMQALSEVLPTL